MIELKDFGLELLFKSAVKNLTCEGSYINIMIDWHAICERFQITIQKQLGYKYEVKYFIGRFGPEFRLIRLNDIPLLPKEEDKK